MLSFKFTKLALAVSVCSGIAVGCSSTSTSTTQTADEDENFDVVVIQESEPLPPKPVPQPEPIEDQERTVHFEFDSAQLTQGEEKNLQALVKSVGDSVNANETNIKEVVIEGYADATGPEEYNQQLSKRRAESVEEYLKVRGIEVRRWDVEAHGEDNPVASNDDKAGRAQNRRVVVTVKADREQPAISAR